MSDRRQDALDYHSQGRRGKIAVVPTKPASTQRDLSLAYSPGVAEPCREIARDPEDVFKYTARGNLVAVVSNGTAAARAPSRRAESKVGAAAGPAPLGTAVSCPTARAARFGAPAPNTPKPQARKSMGMRTDGR